MSTKVLRFFQRFEIEFDSSQTNLIKILRRWRWPLVGALFVVLAIAEIRTSALQAWLFSRLNGLLVYDVAPGPSPRVAFPRSGPFDQRRGYTRIPEFKQRLESAGYEISQQARASFGLARLIALGIAPPAREAADVGLAVRSADGAFLYDFAERDKTRRFERFEDIPPLIVDTLLFIENRELDNINNTRLQRNPAIEWDRLAKAVLSYTGGKLGLPVPPEGGSTLAVQLEKFRHSPDGRTGSPAEKLRQLLAASLRAYRNGPDTSAERHAIIVDYLNTLPLAAVPRHGEIYGLGKALYAWFGMELDDVTGALASENNDAGKIFAYKHTLALLLATRAPTSLLTKNHATLEHKSDQYARLLAKAGVIDEALADALLRQPLVFSATAPPLPPPLHTREKAAASVRNRLVTQLGVSDLYVLDRLHLDVETTIDAALQNTTMELLRALSDVNFVRGNGLDQKQMLEGADPRNVVYSFLLVERGPQGNQVRVQADTTNKPLDFNQGIKLELGSTAKLRTLIHYLEVIAQLHRELSSLDAASLGERLSQARDPMTEWAAKTLVAQPAVELDNFLQQALERRYSASPYENFFTGGGVHVFNNFDNSDNGKIVTLREGFQRSTNLVFIRLMRELVRFHRAQLAYDADQILADIDHPLRRRMLDEIAAEEAQTWLRRAYRGYRSLGQAALIDRFLTTRQSSPRHLAILYFAWKRGADEAGLAPWLKQFSVEITPAEANKLFKAYSNPRLNLADYAYLLSRHPLDLWSAGQLFDRPDLSWEALLRQSAEAQRISNAWLFKTRNRAAQDLRLRIRIEAEAFQRMTPAWQRLAFPFSRLVPSYATAIGNSSDRPAALAELMGIIVNDGARRPLYDIKELHFAAGTPYETNFAPHLNKQEQVIVPAVARAVRLALAEVVERGTAKRVDGAFVGPNGAPLKVGGKTGSGDNRFETFNRYGGVTSSRATSRTAAFVFYLGERHFGVITSSVSGPQAAHYRFTSALPVSVLKLLAPAINERLNHGLTPVQRTQSNRAAEHNLVGVSPRR